MTSNAIRRTALESLYSLKRRKTVLPLTNSFGQLNKPRRDINSPKASLVQFQPGVPRASISSNVVPISRSPILMRKDLFRSNGSNNSVRAHYGDVASSENFDTIHDFSIHDNEEINPCKSSSQSENNCVSRGNQCASDSSLVVVLDMDECLIHSQFLTIASEMDNNYRQQEAGRPPSHAFNYDEEPECIIPSSCESFRLCLPDGDQVHVNKRPNLDSFLEKVTSRYQTYIFTAAMEVYAAPLLDRLDPDGTMFAGRFYREHCTYEPSLGVYVKDLSNINVKGERDDTASSLMSLFDHKKVVLVDNNPYSFLANPTNGILVSNFYDDPKDDTLQAVVELLDEIDSAEDVRPILNEKFGLEDALKEVSKTQGYWK